jgi:hypothetical protein
MAISPISDIVLDVARAADPNEIRAAAAKLQSMSYSAGAESGLFDEALTAAGLGSGSAASADPEGGEWPTEGYAGPSIGGAGSARVAMLNDTALSKGGLSPAQKFEALMMQQMVEGILPEDAESVFGSGTAGGIWKSMLAEQIGNQIAARGGVGIADMITTTLSKRDTA